MRTLFLPVISVLIAFLILLFFIYIFRKQLITVLINPMIKIIMEDKYSENLWELISGMRRMTSQTILENSLRAQSGQVIKRPMGSPKKFPNFDSLVFDVAQIHQYATPKEVKIDMKTVIGPQAKRKLELDIPILISAMGYGIAISEQVKIALAKTSTNVGTAICSGEGALLPEERQYAKHYVIQYARTKWNKQEEKLKQGDMIEVHLGQGATGSLGSKITPEFLPGKARGLMELQPGEDAIINEQFIPGQTHDHLKAKVQELRKLTDGVPIGVKMMASTRVERDILYALDLGVDYIVLDGAQAGTKGSPPITEDDFGIPTIHALVRAVRFLKQKGMYKQVSLIVSGGLYCPGDFLKAIALGADAVYIGTSLLYAMSHTQVLKSLPWEPPTQIVYYTGKQADQFDPVKAEKAATNFLRSCVSEMELGIRALGKTSISQINEQDLSSYDKEMAHVVGIPYTGDSPM